MTMPRLDLLLDPLNQYLRQQNDLSLTPYQRPRQAPPKRPAEAPTGSPGWRQRQAMLDAVEQMLASQRLRDGSELPIYDRERSMLPIMEVRADAPQAFEAGVARAMSPALERGAPPAVTARVPGLGESLADVGKMTAGALYDSGASLVEGGARLASRLPYFPRAGDVADEVQRSREAMRAATEPTTGLGKAAQLPATMAAYGLPFAATAGTTFPILGSAALTGMQSQAKDASLAGALGVENPMLRGALDVGADMAFSLAGPVFRGAEAAGLRGVGREVGRELGQETLRGLQGLQGMAREGRLAPGLSTIDVGAQQDRVAPSFLEGLYSRLERAVEATPMKRGTGQQWLNRLQQAGAPKSEREWTGVEELLRRNLDTPLDREQVLAAARAGRPKLQETVLRSDASERGMEPRWSEYTQPNSSDAVENNWRPSFEAYYSDVPDPIGWGLTEAEAMADARANLREAGLSDEEMDELLSVQEAEPPNPREEPYTEILLRAAPKNARTPASQMQREIIAKARAASLYRQQTEKEYADALQEYYKWEKEGAPPGWNYDQQRKVGELAGELPEHPNYLKTPQERDADELWLESRPFEVRDYVRKSREAYRAREREADAMAARDNVREQRRILQRPYESTHWTLGGKAPSHMQNPVAHIRYTMRNADGEKVLFVEEMQSDLHQDARKAEKRLAELDAREQAMSGMLQGSTVWQQEQRLIDSGRNAARIDQAQGARFPFGETSEWTELGLKRVLDEAARVGADRVVFVTGEQAAESLSADKSLASLTYTSRDGGRTFELSGKPINEYGLISDNTVLATDVPDYKLDDYLGKNAAEKIREQAKGSTAEGDVVGTLSAKDLKLNNTGLRTFYGSFLPSVLQKYAKSLGVKIDIEPRRLRNLKYDQETANPSFRMTPELRRKVLAGQRLMGLSLLAGGAGMGTAASQPQERR